MTLNQKLNELYDKISKELQNSQAKQKLDQWKIITSTQVKQFIKEVYLQKIIYYFVHLNPLTQKIIEIRNLSIQLLSNFINLPYQLMQPKIKQFFQHNGAQNIQFIDKQYGIQFGNIVKVLYQNELQIKYFVETHVYGLKQMNTINVLRVDLKQLFVYKFLHLIEVGPQVQFLFNDAQNFYILTKDLSIDNQNKICHFQTYKQLIKKKSFLLNYKNIGQAIIESDILSRILRIFDVINNPRNIGFIFNEQIGNLKIFDFTPCSNKCYRMRNPFWCWASGNNRYDYSDQFMFKLLKPYQQGPNYKKVDVYKKLISSQNVVNKLESQDIKQKLKQTFNFLIDYINKNESLQINDNQIKDITYFYQSVLLNWQGFREGYFKQYNKLLKHQKMQIQQ